MQNMVDFTIVFILIFSVIVGLFRGFIREALSVASWIAAIWVAVTFSSPFSNILAGFIGSSSLRTGIAFSLLFFLTFLVGSMVSSFFNFLARKSGLKGTDRLLGMAFGLCRGILVVALGIMLVNLTPFAEETWWTGAQLPPKFQPIVAWFQSYIPTSMPNAETMAKLQTVLLL